MFTVVCRRGCIDIQDRRGAGKPLSADGLAAYKGFDTGMGGGDPVIYSVQGHSRRTRPVYETGHARGMKKVTRLTKPSTSAIFLKSLGTICQPCDKGGAMSKTKTPFLSKRWGFLYGR